MIEAASAFQHCLYTSAIVVILPLTELEASFTGRSDLTDLWERLRAGDTDFDATEQLQLGLAQARAHERAGRIAASTECAQAVLDRAREAGDALGVVGGLAQLAYLQYRLGHYAEGERLAAQALAQPLQAPDTVTALHVLGLCASEGDHWSLAESYYSRAADLSRQIGYPLGLSLALHNLALIYTERGQFDLALSTAAESNRLAASFGRHHWAYPLIKTQVSLLVGRRGDARDGLAALSEFAVPGTLLQGFYCGLSAQLALDEDDLEHAEAELDTARFVAARLGNPLASYLLRLNTGRLRRMQGDAPAALDWARENLAELRRMGNRRFEAQALIEQARAEWALGQAAAAVAGLRAALDLAGSLGAQYVAAEAAFLLAALLHEQAAPEADAAWLDAAGRLQTGGYGFLLERERLLAFPLVAAHAQSRTPRVRKAAEGALAQLAQTAPLPLRIIGLGRFQVWQARRQLTDKDWKRRRAGELFRFLLLQPGRAAEREVVLDALWPDQRRDAALAQLHQATSALRRLLEPDLPDKFPSRYLEVSADQVALRLPAGSTVDFERFAQVVSGAVRGAHDQPIAELSDALALYHGALFPADRFADWPVAERERLAQLHQAGQLWLAQALLDAGAAADCRAAREYCQRVLADDPWSEEAVLIGMRACLALNDRPGALRLYHALARALQTDLRLTPRADLRDLARSLRGD